MRIIAGKNKGIVLSTLDGDNTRPTLDRVKEALFSTLDTIVNINELEINNCLDLFSGSGALALETVSRYNCKAVMVDNNSDAINIIKENITRTKQEENCVVKNMNYSNFLESYNQNDLKKYDVIFLDPPYVMNGIDIIDIIIKKEMLSEYGIIVYETDNEEYVEKIKEKYTNREETRIEVIKEKKYSRARLLFLI